MKKFLSLLLVFTLVFSLAACGGKTDEKKEETKKEDSKQDEKKDDKQDDKKEDVKDDKKESGNGKKILNLLESSNIPALITWKATDSVSFLILGNINSGLYTLGEGGVPVEDLVESAEVSEDGLKYTFKLRDANWSTHSGEVYGPVTANDFIYSWKKLLDPKEAAQYAFMISTASVKNGKEAVELNETLVKYEEEEKSLVTMKPEDFKDTDDATAKEQFDKAKADAEKVITDTEAAMTEKYGSMDKAKEALTDLIANLGISAPDDKTFVVELSNPVPYFKSLMAFPAFFPASEKYATETGDKYGKSAENFLYNGAFIFKEWKISERHYLEKNPNYWDAANVKLDGVDFRVIEKVSNDTSVSMYLDGETQTTGLSGENVEKYGTRPDMVIMEDTVIFYLELNQGKGAPKTTKKLLADARARRAINMAIDKKYITDKIFANGSLPADFFVPKGFQSSAEFDNKGFRDVAGDLFDGKEGYNRYNPEEANELWKAAKADLGVDKLEFELLIYQGETQAQVGTHIKNELEKNLEGLTITVQGLPFSEKLKRSDKGDYELNWSGWGPDYPDAMTFMDMWVNNGGHNSTGYSDADYDKVIDDTKSGALTAPDKQKERFQALVELEKKLLGDDQVIVPLYQRSGVGLRDPKVKNYYRQTFGPDYIYKWVDIEE